MKGSLSRWTVVLLPLAVLLSLALWSQAGEPDLPKLSAGTGKPSAEVLAICAEGRALRNKGEHDAARKSFEKALGKAREIKDRAGEAWALSNIASTYRYEAGLNTLTSRPAPPPDLAEKAEYFYQQALKIAREADDSFNTAYATLYLGLLAAGQGKPDQAHKYYEQALPAFKALGDHYYQARTFTLMAQTALHIENQPSKSLPFFEQALPHYREAKVWSEATQVLTEMEFAYSRLASESGTRK